MPLQELVPGPNPARDDVQQTAFTFDVVGRYICNNWQEIVAAQAAGAYPFDAVVIGAGMFGAYCAEKLYRSGSASALRILLVDATCPNNSVGRSVAPIISERATTRVGPRM